MLYYCVAVIGSVVQNRMRKKVASRLNKRVVQRCMQLLLGDGDSDVCRIEAGKRCKRARCSRVSSICSRGLDTSTEWKSANGPKASMLAVEALGIFHDGRSYTVDVMSRWLVNF